jgi:hypothetical protein
MQKMQERFSAQEKYPKETRPMPLAPCASRIYRGLAKRTPVPLPAHGIPAVTLRAIPDKCSDARSGMTGMSANSWRCRCKQNVGLDAQNNGILVISIDQGAS